MTGLTQRLSYTPFGSALESSGGSILASAEVLPEDIAIPVPEIVASFENRFMLEVFPARAVKDGLLKSEPQTYGDIVGCWNGLNETQKKHYRPKASTVLVEELPRFRNMMAHPQHFNLIVFPRAPVGTYELLIDLVAQLWTVG